MGLFLSKIYLKMGVFLSNNLPEDGSVSVQEVRCQVHHDRQLSQLLQQLTRGDCGVVACTTA
jgi:hypothetical protein